ncbi:MAG: serine/threonine protein kinase, partial [Myxococcales bacterium]|nr:serine/threonine protein kinase [Myxococcales bacterium]
MATPLEDPRIGTVVDGRYRVLERIAAGGMGVVYRGERIQIARPVAIKFLLAPFAGDGAFRKRFELEARALSRLSHPNCVSIIDFGVADAPYLVMDFITGRTVQELLDLQGPMAPGRVVAIARQMLAGISHAHGQGIIHRDIKPGNVMVTEDVTGTGDYVRILDFGLAKLRDAGSSISGQKLAVGTPTYMAPEQVLGENVDERSDVYAAGALLFEMLSGKKAFGDAELAEILHHKTAGAVPALRDVAPGCSPAMEQVLQRAMAKEPADRYPSTKALLEALQQTPEASAQRPMAFADTVSLESIEAAPVDPDAIAAAVYSGATTLPAGAPVAAEAAKRASQRQRGGSRRTLFVTLLLLALLGGAAAAYLALGRDTGSAPGSAAAGSSTAGSARATSAAGSGSSAGSAIETNARATASADTVADTAAARADAAGA